MYNRNHIEFIWKQVLFYISTYNKEQGKVRKMISLAHSSISKQLKLKFKRLNKVRTAIIKITKKNQKFWKRDICYLSLESYEHSFRGFQDIDL